MRRWPPPTSTIERWQRAKSESPGNARIDRAGLPIAYFDSRVFSIPDPVEVFNYFVWRQQDAPRNSMSMAAHSCIPLPEPQGKSRDELQEMLFQGGGTNWSGDPAGCKRGRCIVRAVVKLDMPYVDKRTGEPSAATGTTRYS